MNTSRPVKIVLDGLLTPDNCALMLIDHQPHQIIAVKNIDMVLMIKNVPVIPGTFRETKQTESNLLKKGKGTL
jgi:hypothetical protein